MPRVRGSAFTGYFTGWLYTSPRAVGWVTDPDVVDRIENDPLAQAVLDAFANLRAVGLLPVGPRGIGYVLLGQDIGPVGDERHVVKEKPTGGGAFYSFADIGDTITALRRCDLLPMEDVLDGRTECISHDVAVNANHVRRTLKAWAAGFGPDILEDQEVFNEWWVEAQGLAQAVGNVLGDWGIECYSGSGDNPLAAVEAASRRYIEALENGKTVVVCIIGDWDIDGRGNADRFYEDVEAFMEAEGWDGQIDWRWIAPILPDHVNRWGQLAAAMEPGKTSGKGLGVKTLTNTMQGEALLRDNILATIIRETIEGRAGAIGGWPSVLGGVLNMGTVRLTQRHWEDVEAPIIDANLGTTWVA